MQTVQEALREAKKDDLVGHYLFAHPIQMDDFGNETTFGEAKAIARETIADYVDRLRTLEVKSSDDVRTWLFYGYHYPKGVVTEPGFALVSLEDLQQKGIKAPNYGIEFTEQAEIMGYYIADNRLTQYYLADLLVYIMHEASFFGLKQEHLQAELDKLEQANREIKAGMGKTMTREEFEREIGIEDRDSFTSLEEQYLRQMIDYENKIATNSQSAAIKEILRSQINN